MICWESGEEFTQENKGLGTPREVVYSLHTHHTVFTVLSVCSVCMGIWSAGLGNGWESRAGSQDNKCDPREVAPLPTHSVHSAPCVDGNWLPSVGTT